VTDRQTDGETQGYSIYRDKVTLGTEEKVAVVETRGRMKGRKLEDSRDGKGRREERMGGERGGDGMGINGRDRISRRGKGKAMRKGREIAPVVSLLPPGLHSWTITWAISSELLDFVFSFSLFFFRFCVVR